MKTTQMPIIDQPVFTPIIDQPVFTDVRNGEGVKDSSNCYLTINGKKYTQWSDFETKEEMEKQFPNETFIARKQKEGFTRIYQLLK